MTIKFAIEKAWQTTYPVILLGVIKPVCEFGTVALGKNIIGWNNYSLFHTMFVSLNFLHQATECAMLIFKQIKIKLW